MDNRVKKSSFMRIFGVILAIATITLVATGCQSKAKEPEVADVMASISSVVEIPEEVEISKDVLYSYVDITDDQVEGIASIKSANGVNADEVIVVKAAKGKASELEAILKGRVDIIKELFEQYNPEDKDKIDNAIVVKNGDYLLMAVCDGADKVKDTFEKSFK